MKIFGKKGDKTTSENGEAAKEIQQGAMEHFNLDGIVVATFKKDDDGMAMAIASEVTLPMLMRVHQQLGKVIDKHLPDGGDFADLLRKLADELEN